LLNANAAVKITVALTFFVQLQQFFFLHGHASTVGSLVKYHTDFCSTQNQEILTKKAGSASGKHLYLDAQIPLKSTHFNFSSYRCYLEVGAKRRIKSTV